MSALVSLRPRAIFAAILLFFIVAVPTFAGPTYRVGDLNFPADVSYLTRSTFATGIFNGTVVGYAGDSALRSYAAHGVAWFGDHHDHALLAAPPDQLDSHASGVWNNTIVGYTGGGYGEAFIHAMIWTNRGATMTDLHPAGFAYSGAYAVWHDTQVGIGTTPNDNIDHALLWSGSAESVVDLSPKPFLPDITGSVAYAVYGNHQVGMASGHAALWSGNAESFVDLNPADFKNSEAHGVWADHQVGSGEADFHAQHALYWSGSAESLIDLHPAGFDDSGANAIAGDSVVGFGIHESATEPSTYHALLWTSPDPASAIDLHSFLPPGTTTSHATAIDSSGVIVGDADGHAILWIPTSAAAVALPPAVYPGACLLVAALLIPAIHRRRRTAV